MLFRRQKRDDEGINLTPLIDVVFLLLIFFMVSTTFTKETHLNIDLPEAVGDSTQSPEEPLEIVINISGGYSINGQSLVNKQVETLKRGLLEISGGNTSQPLTITADANTPYNAVVTAMDVAGQLGFENLSMTTRRPEAE